MGYMESSDEDIQEPNWVKYGFGIGFFTLGYIVSSIGQHFYGDAKYGSDFENRPLNYIFLSSLGFLVLGGPAVKAVLTMPPGYQNIGYFRIIILYFLSGVAMTGIMMALHVLFEVF